MRWGRCVCEVGAAIAAFDGNTVVALYFSHDVAEFLRDFMLLTPRDRDDKGAKAMVERILADDPTVVPSFDGASVLEREVWGALLKIGRGSRCTYSDIASAIGRPSAVRAVASAIGRNPISYLVPCHRVLRRDGSLAGYRWGVSVKSALLERELDLASRK